MGARVKGPENANFDISPRGFTVLLLISFDFQDFLTDELRHVPYINRTDSFGISCANKTPLKRRGRLRPLK